jgi:hypothetical protein
MLLCVESLFHFHKNFTTDGKYVNSQKEQFVTIIIML